MSPSLREERKVHTSARIADAALALFSERGYAAVTVGEVAAAARVGSARCTATSPTRTTCCSARTRSCAPA